MRHLARTGRALSALSLAAMLSACATLIPHTPSTTAAPTAIPSDRRHTLLNDLTHCGAATSAPCARIHVALADEYLRSEHLNATALDNAARELALAAQNRDAAIETRSLRRVIRILQQRSVVQDACHARLKSAQAQAAAAQARLDRLENLLRDHAEKSLDHPHP